MEEITVHTPVTKAGGKGCIIVYTPVMKVGEMTVYTPLIKVGVARAVELY